MVVDIDLKHLMSSGTEIMMRRTLYISYDRIYYTPVMIGGPIIHQIGGPIIHQL